MDKRAPNNASYYSHPDMHEDKPTLKPLYMLIKVDVDPEIVYSQAKAGTYAINHCDKLEYELVDWFYPNEYHEQPLYPFIKL
mgnify:CR=1 FL=1